MSILGKIWAGFQSTFNILKLYLANQIKRYQTTEPDLSSYSLKELEENYISFIEPDCLYNLLFFSVDEENFVGEYLVDNFISFLLVFEIRNNLNLNYLELLN
jgi:hypothetical protein